MHFTLSNIGETEILFACDFSGKRLRFLYLFNVESLDLFPYLLSLNMLSAPLHCCLVALCASITARHQIIFLQLRLLEKTCEESIWTFGLMWFVPFFCSYSNYWTKKYLFVPGGKVCRVVTTLVFHSFVWVCRWMDSEWIHVSFWILPLWILT